MPLRIESGVESDRWREPSGRGSYEWWYFDGYDVERQTGLVCVFYLGIPFSGLRQRRLSSPPGDFPAVSLSIYGPAGTSAYMVNVHRSAQIEPYRIRIGDNAAALDGGTYEIALNDRLLDGSAVEATLRFRPEASPRVAEKNSADGDLWILSAPRCRFQGEFRLGGASLMLEGMGYHDHNVGSMPLQDRFRRWSWGRAHFRNSTFVYYDAEGCDGNRTFLPSPAQPVRSRRNLYGLRYPAELRVGEVTVRQRRVVDNGPFYLRFLSEFEREGERVTGFSEVLHPRALSWSWFWPLLDARVRSVDNRDRIGRNITQWLIRRGL